MKIILKKRAGGKTTELMKLCHAAKGYFVCATQQECERVYALSKVCGFEIWRPIIFVDFIQARFGKRRPVFIDNLDWCLAEYSSSVEAVSFTDDDHGVFVARDSMRRDVPRCRSEIWREVGATR